MTRTGSLLRPVVVALAVLAGSAAAGLGGVVVATTTAAPAHAADACPTASGVTVLVDFNDLDGDVVRGTCVAGSGGNADDLFAAAGFQLNQQTPGNPGYVCQVSGRPAGCGRPDGDAYWGLWWSDGRSGRWTYATSGVNQLSVPAGGYLAFAWDDRAGDVQPSFEPRTRTAAPSPAPSHAAEPAAQPAAGPADPTRPVLGPGQHVADPARRGDDRGALGGADRDPRRHPVGATDQEAGTDAGCHPHPGRQRHAVRAGRERRRRDRARRPGRPDVVRGRGPGRRRAAGVAGAAGDRAAVRDRGRRGAAQEATDPVSPA